MIFFNCDYRYNVNLKRNNFINNCNLIFIDIDEISFNYSFYFPYHPIEYIKSRQNDIEYGKK